MTKTLIVLVGLPGSGKSTWANEFVENHPDSVSVELFSSDTMRKKTHGDESIQGDNHLLFEELYGEMRGFLRENENSIAVFDATNLSRKRRVHLLQQFSKMNIRKVCVYFATSFEICKAQNLHRSRQVPEHIMETMYKTVQPPSMYEGWNEIQIQWKYDPKEYAESDFITSVLNYDQNNAHHALTLGEHSLAVHKLVSENEPEDVLLQHVALLHDNGKVYTRVEHNPKGEPTENSHYYGHENVGAYESYFYLKNVGFSDNEVIYGASLILNHMRMRSAKTDKSVEKLVRLVGFSMFADLVTLNDADRKAH